jgi:ferredoxin-NADP reductase
LTEVLAPGNPLELRGPIGGYFAWHPQDPQPVLLIGGGSGVVPLMAMARTRAATGSTAPMRLVYSTRGPATLLYAAELQRLAAPGTGLGIDIVYTREAPAGWAGPVGRLDARRLLDLAGPPVAGQQCFICGPTGFVESAARLLVEQGLADRQIRTERFGPSGGTP